MTLGDMPREPELPPEDVSVDVERARRRKETVAALQDACAERLKDIKAIAKHATGVEVSVDSDGRLTSIHIPRALTQNARALERAVLEASQTAAESADKAVAKLLQRYDDKLRDAWELPHREVVFRGQIGDPEVASSDEDEDDWRPPKSWLR